MPGRTLSQMHPMPMTREWLVSPRLLGRDGAQRPSDARTQCRGEEAR